MALRARRRVLLSLLVLTACMPSSRVLAGLKPRALGIIQQKDAAYVASGRIKRIDEAFARKCSSVLPELREHAQRYRDLERVLVFEPGSLTTQGIGTLAWWYVGAWEMGARFDRAAFFSNGLGNAFELNRLFHADAFSNGEVINWNWADPVVRSEVTEHMARFNLSQPDARVDSVCSGNACEYFVWPSASHATSAPHHSGFSRNPRERVAQLARAKAARAFGGRNASQQPHGNGTGESPTRRRRASEGEGGGDRGSAGSAGAPFGSLEDALSSLSHSRWVVVRLWHGQIGRPLAKWPTTWLARRLARGRAPKRRLVFDCSLSALLKPAFAVQRALVLLLAEFEFTEFEFTEAGLSPSRRLVSLHVRTLALDIVLTPKQACGREEHDRQAALLGLLDLSNSSSSATASGGPVLGYSLESAWALWDRMAADNCPACREGAAQDMPAMCSGLSPEELEPSLRGRGTFRTMLACALAHGIDKSAASASSLRSLFFSPPPAPPHSQARIFFATDSVGLSKLLRATPEMSRRLLTSEHAPAHVQCDRLRARLHDACGSSLRQELAGLKAAVDLSMLSISDLPMQYSGSTFFDLAVATNPLLTGWQPGLEGECVRAPWSTIGCKTGIIHWTHRCRAYGMPG